MIIKLLVEGGNMKPGPAIAQKIGPLGLNMGKIISDVNAATKNFEGIKVPVILDIDVKTKTFKVEVSSPPVSELLKKELGIEKGTGDSKKVKVANAAIEQIIKIAQTKRALEKDLKSAVKTVLGSCVSLGILVENKEPKEVIEEINKGFYDKEINQLKTIPDKEKLNRLKEYFEGIKKKQEELLKKEEEEKAKEAAATPTATPQTTAEKAPTVVPKTPTTTAKATVKEKS
ncbi:MAG: 50S ribosomal protein L11 [Candidatus Pacearchaeota archaeon]